MTNTFIRSMNLVSLFPAKPIMKNKTLHTSLYQQYKAEKVLQRPCVTPAQFADFNTLNAMNSYESTDKNSSLHSFEQVKRKM